MIDYEKFSERREQKTPNSIHKMVPHGKWAFTKEVEEERNVVSLAAVFLDVTHALRDIQKTASRPN